MAGKINDFSNDTLINYLTLLGCNVEIKVFTQHPVSKTMKRGMMKVKKTTMRRKNSKPKVRRKKDLSTAKTGKKEAYRRG
jgi:hypothetical protein